MEGCAFLRVLPVKFYLFFNERSGASQMKKRLDLTE